METSKQFVFQDSKLTLEIIIPEIVDPQYGMFTWPAAPVLSQYLFHHRKIIKNKNILELGSGTALAGVTAAKLGGHVILSDADEYKNCLNNCLRSCEANGLRKVQIIPLTWGRVTSDLTSLLNIDFIISSDCFYDKKDFEDILFTVAFILDRNPQAVFLTTYQVRDCNLTIEDILIKWGLNCEEILLSSFNITEGELVAGVDMSSKHLIQMFKISKISNKVT